MNSIRLLSHINHLEYSMESLKTSMILRCFLKNLEIISKVLKMIFRFLIRRMIATIIRRIKLKYLIDLL
jgi:hypothetical protein